MEYILNLYALDSAVSESEGPGHLSRLPTFIIGFWQQSLATRITNGVYYSFFPVYRISTYMLLCSAFS